VRKALSIFAVLIVGVGSLFVLPAGAQATDEYEGPTYIECENKPATGQFHQVVPVGPGKIWVSGRIQPCRTPGPHDSALIAEMGPEAGNRAGGPSVVYYRRTASGQFSRVVTLGTDVRRVCLADTPESAVDCYAVRVPEKAGKPGVPVVKGRTTTADISIPPTMGLCGFCW
jgi:hypothetical protein